MEVQSLLRSQANKHADDLRSDIVGKLTVHMKDVQDAAVAQNELMKSKASNMEKVITSCTYFAYDSQLLLSFTSWTVLDDFVDVCVYAQGIG